MDPKKHHYIPQSLLKRFGVGGGGRQVWVYDKQSRRSYLPAIRDAGAENYFYSVEVKSARLTLEAIFQDIDDQGASVLDEVCKARSLAGISRKDVLVLSAVAAAQLLRVKMPRTELKQLGEQLQDLLERFGADAGDREEISENQARISTIEQLFRLPDFALPFLEKDLILIAADPSNQFIIGDNPVAAFNFFPYGEQGLASEGVAIFLPISGELTLGFFCPTIRRQLEQVEGFAGPEFQDVLDALRRGLPATSDGGRWVDFINHLQVQQASRYLFSSVNDFSLVEALLEEAPHLAEVKTRISTGWEGYFRRERMPAGTFVVAFGQSNHYMIPAEILDQNPEECEFKFRSAVSAMIQAAANDGPFSVVRMIVDQVMMREIRDVIFLIQENGEVWVRCRDEGLHQLFRTISRRGG